MYGITGFAARTGLLAFALACVPAWAVPKQKTIAVDNASGGSVAGHCTLAQAIVAANKDDNPGDATHPYGNTPPGATTLDPLGDSVASVAATDIAPANAIANGCALTVTDATNANRTEYLIDLAQIAGQTIIFDPESGIYPNQGWNARLGTCSTSNSECIDGTKADNYWYGPNALPPIASRITIVGRGVTLQVAVVKRLRFFFVGADATSQATPGYDTPGAGYLTLRNLTLTGGRQLGGAAPEGAVVNGAGAGMGGAVFNQGAVSFEAVTLTNNWAIGGDSISRAISDSGAGGGMGSGGLQTFGGTMGGPVPRSPVSSPSARFTGLAGFSADGTSRRMVATVDGGAAGNVSYWNDGIFTGGSGGGFSGGPGTSADPIGSGSGGGFGTESQGGFRSGSGGGVGGGGAGLYAGGGFGGGGASNSQLQACLYCGSSGFGAGGLFPGFGGEVGGGGGLGGAIFNFGGEVYLINATLSGNQARGGRNHSDSSNDSGIEGDGYGSAIFNLNGTVLAAFTTLANNPVSGTKANGAIYSLGYNANPVDSSDPDWLGGKSANLWLANSIVSGTVANGTSPAFDVIVDAPPKVIPVDDPLFDNHAISDFEDFGAVNLIGRSKINNAIVLDGPNPNLRPLAVNLPPGATSPPTYVPPTMTLPPGSPASGKGECGGIGPFYFTPPGVDERGAPRPTSGVACDLGAFQLQPGDPVAILVTTEQDYDLSVAANTSDGLCSLREAIDNANSGSRMRPDCDAGNGTRNLVQFAPNVKHIVVSLAAGGNMPIGGYTTIDGGSAGVTRRQRQHAHLLDERGPDRHAARTELHQRLVQHGRCGGELRRPHSDRQQLLRQYRHAGGHCSTARPAR
jgi:hypothetical protein